MKLMTAAALFGSVFASLAAKASVSRTERALVVLTELDQNSYPELRPMYTAMERLTADVPRSVLGQQYSTLKILKDQNATLQKLKTTLYSLAANSSIKAIDMIVNTHGTEDVLHFNDGGTSMRHIREEILSPDAPYSETTVLKLKQKLRMLYSTACFGESHNSEWIRMGFDVTDGSLGVNANAVIEYPSVVHAWSTGQPYFNGFRLSNTDAALLANDGPLRLAGQLGNNFLREVNSKKIFRGNTAITINSNAQ